jgi:uncharacterized membrane protein
VVQVGVLCIFFEKSINALNMMQEKEVDTTVPESPRTASVICYFTIVGWIIPYYCIYKGNKRESTAFHLRQSLLLQIVFVVIYALGHLTPPGAKIFFVGIWLFMCLWGIVSALAQSQKPIPFLGEFAQTAFKII